MRPGAEPALAARGVTFAYGPGAEPVLRDLDLDVPPGTHLAVVGPSSIGRSTLAALLCGLRAPDSGTVSYGVSGAVRAGERQLLALARAYLSPAPIAVLVEATCHLGLAAERRVEEAFAARGSTLVVIAHRSARRCAADRVLVLDGAGAAAATTPRCWRRRRCTGTCSDTGSPGHERRSGSRRLAVDIVGSGVLRGQTCALESGSWPHC